MGTTIQRHFMKTLYQLHPVPVASQMQKLKDISEDCSNTNFYNQCQMKAELIDQHQIILRAFHDSPMQAVVAIMTSQ